MINDIYYFVFSLNSCKWIIIRIDEEKSDISPFSFVYNTFGVTQRQKIECLSIF